MSTKPGSSSATAPDAPAAADPFLQEELRPDGVLWLRMNRPQRRNALSTDAVKELAAAWRRVHQDPAVRVVVLCAAGPVFCSGHDLKELERLAAQSGAEAGDAGTPVCLEVFVACSRMMAAIPALPKPVIAAVQGLATAAGCQLAASCDLVIAAESAAFATPGVDIGLFCSTPAVGLGRAIGRKAAMEMLLLGERVGARRAYELGLVNRVVADEDLEREVEAIANRIASRSAATIAMGKQTFYRQIEQGLEAAYTTASLTMAENLAADDAREGIRAFFEKRPARFANPAS